MPKKPLVLAFALLLISLSPAQEPKKAKKPLKNADIVLMTQNHFDDETLSKLIEVSDTDFDISGDALVELKNQGVSAPVIRAMLEAAARKKLAADADIFANTDPPAAEAPRASSASGRVPSAAAPETPDRAVKTASSPSSSAPFRDTPQSPAGTAAPAASGAVMASPPAANMPVNPQLAVLQSQLAMMGLAGLGRMFGGAAALSYTAEQLPHVFLMDAQIHSEKHEVSASMAQIAQTKMKTGTPGPGGMALRSLATEGLSFAAMGAGPTGMMAMSAFSMASGFMPGMRAGAPSMTYVWGLPGRKSARELSNPDPIFQLNYGDIPGVDPDAFEPAIVRLVQTPDNYRLVGATRTKLNTKNLMSGNGPENGKWISEERWPVRVYKEDRGFYVLRVDQPLEPGEYAVVLRPVKGYRATASGLGGHAQVFYSVWDFSVPGAAPTGSKKKKK